MRDLRCKVRGCVGGRGKGKDKERKKSEERADFFICVLTQVECGLSGVVTAIPGSPNCPQLQQR
jgi:hypothetical protein